MPLVSPIEAIQTGEDKAVCGDCPLRRRICYVNMLRGPLNVWKRIKDMRARKPIPNDKPIRLGAYGDPFFIPRYLLKLLTQGRKHVGYTHQWMKKKARGLERYCMASIDRQTAELHGVTVEELREQAKRQGYRTYRILEKGDSLLPGEIMCPHSTHGVQCIKCLLCDGKRSQYDKRKDIAVYSLYEKAVERLKTARAKRRTKV